MEFILFFLPLAKEERNPTIIAHIAKDPQANAQYNLYQRVQFCKHTHYKTET